MFVVLSHRVLLMFVGWDVVVSGNDDRYWLGRLIKLYSSVDVH